MSADAAAKIQKSADGAGEALGEAANAGDFGALSKNAQAAADSMDHLKGSAVGTGTALDKAKEQLKGLLATIGTEASAQFHKVGDDAKTVGTGVLVATGIALAVFVSAGAALVYRLGVAAFEAAGFINGLFTGTSYQTKYIDGLIAANDKVKDLQVSLGITATSASALGLALDRIGVPKGDYVGVYTSTETAVRKLIAAQDELYQKASDARHGGDPQALKDAEDAVNAQTSAFKRLGVQITDEQGKTLDYQTIIQNAAKVLDTYTAGYDRNAAAAELGIGSAEKVANSAKVNSVNFAEAAKRQQDYYLVIGPGAQAAIDQYQTAMRLFRNESDLTSEGIKRAIADATIPILTELADFLKDGFPSAVTVVRGVLTGLVTVFEGFELSAKALYEIGSFAFTALELSISASLAAIQKVIHFDFAGAKKEVEEGARAIEARFTLLLDNVSGNLAKARAAIDLASGKDSEKTPVQNEKQPGGRTYTPPPSAPAAPKPAGATAAVVDVQKKILDQQLKTLELFIGREKELLTERDEFLSLYYQDGDISIRDYYAGRDTAQREFLAKAKAGYAEEIADLESYIAKTKANSAFKPDEAQSKVIEANTKIIEVRDKLRKVEADANKETLKDWFANRKAVEQYGDSLTGLVSQIKSFSGDTAGAFADQFDVQNRTLTKQLNAVRQSDSASPAERSRAVQAIIDLDQIKQQGIATAQLNDLTSQRSVILGDLANQQARIDLAVSTGQKSEIQGLADISAANAARLPALQKIVDAYDAIAATSNNRQDLINADTARVELEKLASQTDLVADKFNALGQTATENFIDKLVNRTATLKDALKGLFADLNKQLLLLAERSIGDSLFGKGGTFADFGKLISSQISPTVGAGAIGGAAKATVDTAGSLGSSAAKVAANDAAFSSLTSTLTAAVPVTNTALDSLSSAAASAAVALRAVGGGSGGSSIAGIAGAFGGSGGGVQSAGDYAALDLLASAKGNVFDAGNVIPFAKGGVFDSPTVFPMRNGGIGLLGEAGPEAIVPLRRGRDGRLGISGASQGSTTTVTNIVNVQAPATRDLRSADQYGRDIARQLSR